MDIGDICLSLQDEIEYITSYSGISCVSARDVLTGSRHSTRIYLPRYSSSASTMVIPNLLRPSTS